MVKLEAYDTTFGGVFYFHNLEDCVEFVEVFKDHWCNVAWKYPVESDVFPELTSNQRKLMNKNPKMRAMDNLGWGHNYVKRLGIDLTPQQKSIATEILNAKRVVRELNHCETITMEVN